MTIFRDFQDKLGQPLCRVGCTAAWAPCAIPESRDGSCTKRRDLRGQSFRGEIALLDADGAAAILQDSGVRKLVLIQACGRGRIAGRPMADSSATVDAPEREMTKWAAAMRAGKSEKNGATSAATPRLA